MVKLDEMDRLVLRELEKDARSSYRTIAKRLGISVGTVHNRISKLKKHGVIKRFITELNEKKLGYAMRFLILLTIENKHIENILKKLAHDYPQIVKIYRITGEYSALLICRFKDPSEVEELIMSLSKEDGIIRTTSSMILSVIKNTEYQFFHEDIGAGMAK